MKVQVENAKISPMEAAGEITIDSLQRPYVNESANLVVDMKAATEHAQTVSY
jgi:hypothetical protein